MATASSEYFVVKPKSADLVQKLTAEAAGPQGLVICRNPTPSTGPRQEWDRLMREYGDDLEFAAPVIVDDQGQWESFALRLIEIIRDCELAFGETGVCTFFTSRRRR